MRKPFNCLVCGTKVNPDLVHYACHRTCGSPECQAIYQKRSIAKADRRRQRNRIEKLKQQGIGLVTCAVCKQQFEMIGYNHLKTHGLTTEEYKRLYPNLAVINLRMKLQRGGEAVKRFALSKLRRKKARQRIVRISNWLFVGRWQFRKTSE